MEFDINPMDDNWLTAAADFNLIDNAYGIGVIKDNNIQDFNKRYKDLDIGHCLFKLSHLDM